MDSKELLNLIRFVAKAGVSGSEIQKKDFEINIKTPLAGGEAPYKFCTSTCSLPSAKPHL